MIGKDRLVFDTTTPDDTDNVGAYIRGADGTIITHTTEGAKEALDVYVANQIDIASDHAEDSAHVSGDIGSFALGVRNDTNTVLTSADGDYSPIAVDSAGRLKVVADFSAAFDFVYAEDSAHTTGDPGAYVLSVREDTLTTSTSASGDYQSMKTDAHGRMWINATNQTMAFSAVTVTTTATDLVATDLANRKRILVENLGNRPIYVGSAAVTDADGFRISNGSALELDIGPGVNIHGITSTGSSDVRIIELA